MPLTPIQHPGVELPTPRMYKPSKQIYDQYIYGTTELAEFQSPLHVTCAVHSTDIKRIQVHALVNARYKPHEPTIEDVYSYATTRYMMLGCLDGPTFPLKDGD